MDYNPQIFDVGSLDQAKRIILTREIGARGSTEERWKSETPFLAQLAIEHLQLGRNSVVLDYGCGVGRLARELIKLTGCIVVGADISVSMRALAATYVNSRRFFTVHPYMLVPGRMNFKFTHALSVWVLQHCLDPNDDIRTIYEALPLGGRLLVVNNKRRALPVTGNGPFPWADDGINIEEALSNIGFMGLAKGTLDPDVGPDGLVENTFWKVLERGTSPTPA